MIWQYIIYIIRVLYMYIFDLIKYNIIHVNSSKYIKLMLAINYINTFNYLYRVIQFDVVSYLHVPGI